jgi:sulfite reductase (ferredoxin)
MTTTQTATDQASNRSSRPARTAPAARRKKGEGQWALGYREPLNQNEQSKKDNNPLLVRERIENIYRRW